MQEKSFRKFHTKVYMSRDSQPDGSKNDIHNTKRPYVYVHYTESMLDFC